MKKYYKFQLIRSYMGHYVVAAESEEEAMTQLDKDCQGGLVEDNLENLGLEVDLCFVATAADDPRLGLSNLRYDIEINDFASVDI